MRDILFRGKRLFSYGYNDSWIEGGFHQRDGKSYIIGISKNYRIDGCEVDPETVGQYTGLTVNGTKIFEGDICRNTKTGEIVSVAWHGTMAGYVWSRRKEGCKHLFDFGELFRCYDKYEVIGNIHDNPELLEGGVK